MVNVFYFYFLTPSVIFLKNYSFTSGASPDLKIQLPQERINALISAKVLHTNANEARDVDCICTSSAMECLLGYALKPSFDPAW